MIRLLFLVHRYLGIAIGFILLLWCLSGIVMMYVRYPEMELEEKLQTLAPLNLQECCALSEMSALPIVSPYSVIIEMLDQTTPVLRIEEPGSPPVTWDLRRGVELRHFEVQTAQEIVSSAVNNIGGPLMEGPPQIVETDQWTVTGAYNQYRPLYLFEIGDNSETELYVSSTTGEVVLITTGPERFWNYLGAVVHWLYPAILRQHPTLWSQVVIWLSVAGVFLTVTGLYVGLRQFSFRNEKRLSPYSGIALWHHYAGLVSRVIALLWVGSGLLSMNPWGLLEGEGASKEVSALQGGGVGQTDMIDVLERLPDFPIQSNTLRLELYRVAGSLFISTVEADGSRERYDAATFLPAPLSDDDLQGLALIMLPGIRILEAEMLETGDAYYYEHHAAPEFPVFRVIADDDERRRYYLSATTGQLVAKADSGARLYRWLFAGLHRADFIPQLRDRPLWDVLMLLMLAAVTLLCGTGTYLGFKRLMP